jgi:hypothetical protein
MEVSELNKLLKMHRQMADVMKKMGKMGKKGLMRQMGGMLGLKGGMPSEAEIAKARDQLAAGGGLPKGLPGWAAGCSFPRAFRASGRRSDPMASSRLKYPSSSFPARAAAGAACSLPPVTGEGGGRGA